MIFNVQGRIQFFIEASDAPVAGGETELVIDRFRIDLDQLQLGADFTGRTRYTNSIFNTPDDSIDLSFRVQCSENYYGPNCTTFCEPVEGVYTCDNEGRIVCVGSRNLATNCTTCRISELDLSTECTQCLFSGHDPTSDCADCLPGRDPSSDCTICLPGRDLSTNCANCLPGRDPSTNCNDCLPGRDPAANCTECFDGRDLLSDCQCFIGRNELTNCTTCIAGYSMVGGDCLEGRYALLFRCCHLATFTPQYS